MMGRYTKSIFIFLFVIICSRPLTAQPFTHADSLRGGYGPSRNWWNATKYDLHVKFNINDSSISGWNEISYKVIKKGSLLQIDLQAPLILDSIQFETSSIYAKPFRKTYSKKDIRKDGYAYFINVPNNGSVADNSIKVYYHGKPRVAKRAPWDGGVVWTKDQAGNPWITIACQGLGASVWYPCKDSQADEPDSAAMHITIPDSLMAVGNGRFRGKTDNNDGTASFDWAVINPINNYNIIPYIGKYTHFGEVYDGENGKLDMDYWVLDSNLSKAKEQFKDAPRMMKAFEYWFGPYPFYEDGFKLVDAPHLGMEHQSAVAYGNKYLNGYLGKDLSGSGWGLKWDYIIIHESGHEWFANNITTKDIADMWVQEGFTTYSEVLFTEYFYGKQAADEYLVGLRKRINNNGPIVGKYGVNNEGSGDMYSKGASIIHTIRQAINNDSLFRQILRGLNKTFWHQTVTTKQVEDYISKQSKINFSKIFNQYLRTALIPVLEYKQNGFNLSYRYTNCITGFNLPLRINFKGERWIKPSPKWKTLKLYPEGDSSFSADPNFYINTKKLD
ncbi:MAG: M1 family metallopeptidase [Ferruginibacter sp.]